MALVGDTGSCCHKQQDSVKAADRVTRRTLPRHTSRGTGLKVIFERKTGKSGTMMTPYVTVVIVGSRYAIQGTSLVAMMQSVDRKRDTGLPAYNARRFVLRVGRSGITGEAWAAG